MRHTSIISYFRGLCALLLIIFVQEAAAQPPDIGSQADQFLQSKFNRDAINESIRNYSNALPSRCKELEIGTKFNVFVFYPLQFSPDGGSSLAPGRSRCQSVPAESKNSTTF